MSPYHDTICARISQFETRIQQRGGGNTCNTPEGGDSGSIPGLPCEQEALGPQELIGRLYQQIRSRKVKLEWFKKSGLKG